MFHVCRLKDSNVGQENEKVTKECIQIDFPICKGGKDEVEKRYFRELWILKIKTSYRAYAQPKLIIFLENKYILQKFDSLSTRMNIYLLDYGQSSRLAKQT